MRKIFLTPPLFIGALAAVISTSVPVLAQNDESEPSQQTQIQQEPLTPTRVVQSLQQAGFQNIDIIDTAYLVEAQTKDGNTVTMLINPPTIVDAMEHQLAPGNSHQGLQQSQWGGNVGNQNQLGIGSQGYQTQYGHPGFSQGYQGNQRQSGMMNQGQIPNPGYAQGYQGAYPQSNLPGYGIQSGPMGSTNLQGGGFQRGQNSPSNQASGNQGQIPNQESQDQR